MAKKNKGTFSYLETQQALESIAEKCTKDNIVFELLRIFCGYGDASIQRIIDGRGNDARDGRTILIKKLIAYRATENGLFGDDNLYDIIEAMHKDSSIYKKEPRLYVASDGKRIIAYDPKEEDLYDNDISLMWKDFDFFKPLAGIEKFRNIEEAEADVKSAEIMAKIYDDIRRYNDVHDKQQVHNINAFMTRLLFCYFAEDTGLFPVAGMFTNAIREDTKADGSDLEEFLDGIFDIMAIDNKQIRASLPKKITQFPYVNGGLFKAHYPIPTLSRRTRILMLKCGEYNWAEINPDIFGSMIQAVINPEERAGFGVHYTSVPNIMKVIRPLFLDELTEEFIRVKDDERKLKTLLFRLSKIKFFDPACGSGNFLIIAYKCIRELEIQIWDRLKELGRLNQLPFSNISLTQFYGIEIDEYACETAKLSLWLAEHQVNNLLLKKYNSKVDALPLGKSGNIVCGNACRLDWNTVCPHTADEEVYVMGNPPYLGSSRQDETQKLDMSYVFCNRDNYKKLDYISCWFELASIYISDSICKCAFVSTNSITQGEQVPILWQDIFERGVSIYFAYTSFMWHNNAKNTAKVAVSIIGIADNKYITYKKIYSTNTYRIVNNINAYLLDAPNVYIIGRHSSISNFPEMIKGCAPVDDGCLLLSKEEKESLLHYSSLCSKFIKKYVGAEEFVNGGERFCIWVEDDIETAYSNPFLADRFSKCKNFRLNSKKEGTRKIAVTPHLFGERKYKPLPSIVVPQTGSERRRYLPMGIADKGTVLSNAVRVIYGGDMCLYAIVASYMHMVWIRTVAGRLKQDMQYSNTICYNTFPFPKITKEKKEQLSILAEAVLLTRENHTEMTLGEMYNPETMPNDLKEAHKALDIAVEQCYRTEPFTSDEERLEYLFKLYEKMTKKK